MIKIAPTVPGPSVAASRKKKTSHSGGSGFAGFIPAETEESGEVAPPSSAAALNPANPLLGLQEISDEEVRRRQAARRGTLTLDALEELKLAMLSGQVTPDTLEQIERMVAGQRAQTNDAGLEAVLDEIELRAAVELAKLDAARSR